MTVVELELIPDVVMSHLLKKKSMKKNMWHCKTKVTDPKKHGKP